MKIVVQLVVEAFDCKTCRFNAMQYSETQGEDRVELTRGWLLHFTDEEDHVLQGAFSRDMFSE